MRKNILLPCSLLLFAVMLMSSCKKKDDDNAPISPPVQDDAVYVINEGAFMGGNGTIDFYSPTADSISNDVFGYVNTLPLGDVVQSMTIFGEKGYICVNNSQKLEVVNMADFVDYGSSNGFQGPRYFLGINSTKGYVSDWFSDKVKVVNLVTLAVIDSIPTGAGPEQMILADGKVFVTNVGGYGNDSTVTVIDANTNAVITTIEVGLNPNSIKKDFDGRLWVLCGGTVGPDYIGGTSDDRAGSLVRINPATLAVDKTLPMSSSDHPVKLAVNGYGNYLYYLKGTDGYKGTVYKMKNTDVALPVTPVVNKEFYGLGINPVSGDIYGGFAPDFTQNGTMYRYNSNGVPIATKTTGIGPNGFAFY